MSVCAVCGTNLDQPVGTSAKRHGNLNTGECLGGSITTVTRDDYVKYWTTGPDDWDL